MLPAGSLPWYRLDGELKSVEVIETVRRLLKRRTELNLRITGDTSAEVEFVT